jgi:hypothetical protein
MDEPIVEQLAQCIADAIDGQRGPAGTMTLRAVRPNLLDWGDNDCKHGDCVIELTDVKTQSATSDSRIMLGTWLVFGVVRTEDSAVPTDRVICRMAETIRRLLLAWNSHGRACGGLARKIDCPKAAFGDIGGGVGVEVTVTVEYETAIGDGYR